MASFSEENDKYLVSIMELQNRLVLQSYLLLIYGVENAPGLY